MKTQFESKSIIGKKSFLFALEIVALEIVGLYKHLVYEKKEYILSKQLMRSGTSIGANINEATHAQSKRDFVHKLNIALKEARETQYWICLLRESDFISHDRYFKLNSACLEHIKMLSSIILTTKQKYFNQNKPTLNS